MYTHTQTHIYVTFLTYEQQVRHFKEKGTVILKTYTDEFENKYGRACKLC